ncbi:MAG: YceI family protein [Actinomycetota bacterium]
MSVTAERIGTTLPAYPQAGTWKIDNTHTAVGFTVRHLMVSKVRGSFTRYDGSITIGETPEQSSVEVTIDASSIDTRDETRDAHLRSPDFLDVENHPTLQFVSTRVAQTGQSTGTVTGDLTIRGVTRPVELEVEFLGLVTDPWGGRRLGVSVTGEIDREEFGLTWNQALEAGGVLVGRKIKLEIEAEAMLSA